MNPDALPEEFTPVPEGHRPMPAHSNRPSFDDIRSMPIGEIAALPGIHLALLQEDAEAALAAARTLKDWLEGAIALRYADRAAELRREQGKDTGTARFADGDVVVVADLLKKVEWDQAQLAALVALVERIRAGATIRPSTSRSPTRCRNGSTQHGPPVSARHSRRRARSAPASRPSPSACVRKPRETADRSDGAARSARTGRQSFGARSAPRRIPKPTLSRSRP